MVPPLSQAPAISGLLRFTCSEYVRTRKRVTGCVAVQSTRIVRVFVLWPTQMYVFQQDMLRSIVSRQHAYVLPVTPHLRDVRFGPVLPGITRWVPLLRAHSCNSKN